MAGADIVSFIALGLATVLGTLTLLALLCAATGAVFTALERRREQAALAERALGTEPAQDDRLSPELIAVLTAAAQESLKRPVRMVSVQSPQVRAWAKAGREQEHQPHRLR